MMSDNSSATLLFGIGNVELKVSGKVVYYVGICGKYKVIPRKPNIIQDDEIVRAKTIDILKKYAAKYLKKYLQKNNVNPSNSNEHIIKLQTIISKKICTKSIEGFSIQFVELEKLYFRHANVELPPIMILG